MAFKWLKLGAFARKSTVGPLPFDEMLRYLSNGLATSSGALVTSNTAMQAATVFSCVKVLSESIGMLPFHLQRLTAGGGRENAEDHPLYSVLHDQPNDYQTAPEFLEMIVAHMNLRGNAYAWVNRTKRGDVAELLPQHPDLVRPEMRSDYTMVYHVRFPDGTEKTFGLGDIVHFRGITLNGWLGITPIAYNREAIGLAMATERFGGLIFRNGAKPGGVLETTAKLSQPAYDRLKESFNSAFNGEEAGKTAILEEGVKFTKLSMNSTDAQFLETRKYQRSEIAALFRVPPHMIGDLEKATFANIEQLSLEFATYSLMPWLVRIEKSIKRDLLNRSEKKSLSSKFNTAALMRGDAKSRSEYYASGITNGWMTRNEARARESDIGMALNPIDGLSEPMKPLNMIGINEPTPEPTGDTGEPGSGGKPQKGGA